MGAPDTLPEVRILVQLGETLAIAPPVDVNGWIQPSPLNFAR